MKKFYILLLALLSSANVAVQAQQVPNAGFEDWSGAAFDGNAQPANWNASNVAQLGFKFNFAHKETGHTGSASMMVQGQEVGAMGIKEPSPGYFSLGQPWAYIKNLDTDGATAGTEGGISWTYRPDTMSVWIKRTGNNTDKEDFYLLYYAWSGTAKGSKYTGKNGKCTSVSKTNEESDIRQALDANGCGTDQKANQIAEGMWRERKTYGEWTNIRVPIYYFNNDVPTMMNIIFSASNYPNFRANNGLNPGNSLYVDDVELIYASTIQKLYIGGKEWRGFNPNTSEEQVYSLGRSATTIPEIKGLRGAGSLTNAAGTTVTLVGRELGSNEMSIVNGEIDGAPTVITVKSEDGKSTTTYKIKFVREASSNANLAGININGKALENFQQSVYAYTVELPYGTTAAPVISTDTQEDAQTVEITQASSTTGKATIVVTAGDKTSQATYTIQFKVGALSDNTLIDIQVNGTSVAGFAPNKMAYQVSLPTTTTTMPAVKGISAYPDGAQTIKYIAPATIDRGIYQIQVSSPGNPTPKTYKLTFKLEASSYSYLKSLQVGDGLISNFDPEQTTYYVNLPIGTTELPKISYELGEPTQQVSVQEGGLDGTTKVIVTAGDGVTQTEYKVVFSTEKSDIVTLKMIYIGGEPLADFSADKTDYTHQLPIGTTVMPDITFDKGDEYQTVRVVSGGLNGITRITVVAGNGSSMLYQISMRVQQATNATLKMIYVGGKPLEGFTPQQTEYDYRLPKGTTQLPVVTYDKNDDYQTVTTRSGGVNDDYKITVRPQTGASMTYVIHFSVETSDNTALQMIYLDGKPLSEFDSEVLQYTHTLPVGVSKIPSVTFDKGEESQKVLSIFGNNVQTITVTAESGKSRTYTITFVIQRSESAYLKMIYLDGDSLRGFDKQTFDYTTTLTGSTCPRITVDKEDGQQVTITTPYAAGRAQIVVRTESGASNIYTVEFTSNTKSSALLPMIYVNGQAVSGYQSDVFEYDLEYIGVYPSVTYDAAEGQNVTVFREHNTLTVYVISGADKAKYTLRWLSMASADCILRNILLDGKALSGFSPKQKTYNVQLPAGATLPAVTYEMQNDRQTVYAGWRNGSVYDLLVSAENGDTTRYSLQFDIAKSYNANLLDMSVDGYDIHFVPTTYEYRLNIAEGIKLPALHITPDSRQSTEMHNVNDHEQQVTVVAESGKTNIYRVLYTRTQSAITGLADILIDGQSLQGFRSDVHEYVDSLAWRTTVVPCVQPIGLVDNQTITTYHSAINGITRIHIEAADGVTTADYQIAFPVRQSGNTALNSITIAHESVTIDFDPDQTEYTIRMPLGEQAAPLVSYEVSEEEQNVRYIARPLGQTSQLIVTAENGNSRTYNLSFLPTYAEGDNLLAAIKIGETGQVLSPSDTVATIALPYGCRTLTAQYTKSFAGQSVWVQPGGINAPTIITVRSNRPNDKDITYTLTPQVETQNPAVLTGITVNGQLVKDFDPNRFSYIVNVTSSPIIEYTKGDKVVGEILVNNSKHWQIRVTAQGQTNLYDLWFYYTDDVIPNGEFSEWTTAKYNNAQKPAGWQVLADAAEKGSTVWGTYKSGDECKQSDAGIAFLKTAYSAKLMRSTPGFMTLGTISGELNTENSFQITGGIPFHNSPDTLKTYYKAPKIVDYNRIVYILSGSNGTYTEEHNDSKTFNDYQLLTIDLADINQKAGMPNSINLIFNSNWRETGNLGNQGGMGTQAEMYVDWVRFSYNSTLTALTVNGIDAAMEGNAFTATLTDAEQTGIPALSFTGEVSDQAQQIEWQDEVIDGAFGVRNAVITNYAEDGTSTRYTLNVRRPLDTRNTLKDLQVDGITLSGFTPDSTDYTYHLNASNRYIPDITPVAQGYLQTVTTHYADSTCTITVTPESGNSKVYTIRFVTDLSDDVQLAGIFAAGITFNPEQTEYDITADRLPVISFTKKSDGQTVDLSNGILTVTAENGNQGTYTIHLHRPAVTTTAQLDEIELDGIALRAFTSDTYDYTHERPARAAFRRTWKQDSVVFVQSPKQMQWHVFGTGAQHTYTITYPTTLSDDTTLDSLLLNGKPLPDFNRDITDYTVTTDHEVHLHAFANISAQSLTVTRDTLNGANAYLYTVTAENGTVGKTYRINILPQRSSEAHLNGIYLNDVLLSDFRPDQYQYTFTLPAGAYKEAEPVLPSLRYELGTPHQQVSLEYGRLGETTNIFVTSEDGTASQLYTVLVQAEPSHNAHLTGIAVNDVPVQNFKSERLYYSARTSDADIRLSWSADDRFQTVTTTRDGDSYTLHVTAQDGTTTKDYLIDIYRESPSNDATLADILLDGNTFSAFHTDLNPILTFSPTQQTYTINLPSGTTSTPEVSARLKLDGQSVEVRQQDWTTYLDVTAPDGTTVITYALHFLAPQSGDANLRMIFINGDSLPGFAPDRYTYFVSLPIGETTLPDLIFERGEVHQTVRDSLTGTMQRTLFVTAENGNTRQYTLTFTRILSTIDTLRAIYGDGMLISGFRPDSFYYAYTLPVGTDHIPDLTWDNGDRWQTIDTATVMRSEFSRTTQLQVTAMSGSRNTYTVAYTIARSSCDTLQMIYFNGQPLPDFIGTREEYTIDLAAGDSLAPASSDIIAMQGDEWQTVTPSDLVPYTLNGTQIGWRTTLLVTAQDGRTRTYNLFFTFTPVLSDNTDLANIYLAGHAIPDFRPDRLTYFDTIPEGGTRPSVLVEKGYAAQSVTITEGDTTLILVTAENATAQATYRVIFTRLQSPYALLDAILQDGELLPDFRPDSFEYCVTLPYGTATLPVFTVRKGHEGQQITIDTLHATVGNRTQTTIRFSVTAADLVNSSEYDIRILNALNDNCRLRRLLIRGTDIEGFHGDTLLYHLTYPIGTDSTALVTLSDIQAEAEDADANVSVTAQGTSFIIQVTAADGVSARVYTITQTILLSANTRLSAIYLDSALIRDFDPDILDYTYYITDVRPAVHAVPEDENATVEFSMYTPGEPFYIYVTAPSGDEQVYSVLFLESTIHTATSPTANDVLVKHIGGTMQLVFATIRKNVSVAVYTEQGNLVYYAPVPESDQNDATIVTNVEGSETIIDVHTPKAQCTLPNCDQRYLYIFFENDKRRITSGKIALIR